LLDLPIWASAPPEKLYDLSPRTVLEGLDAYPKHRQRIEAADLSFPIHVMHWRGRYVIMDGFHRLLKAKLQKLTEVAVFEVPQALIPEIQPELGTASDFLQYELARRGE
jgi:hypothetical protein